MTETELRRKIADLVTELDTIIDNKEDVLPVTAALVNTAANALASAYLTVPGRFITTDDG